MTASENPFTIIYLVEILFSFIIFEISYWKHHIRLKASTLNIFFTLPYYKGISKNWNPRPETQDPYDT